MYGGEGSRKMSAISTTFPSSSHASPRLAQKSGASLFGLFTKRPSRVEPHGANVAPTSKPTVREEHATNNRDVTFAKCTLEHKPTPEHKPLKNCLVSYSNPLSKKDEAATKVAVGTSTAIGNQYNVAKYLGSSGGGGLISSLQRHVKPSKGRGHKHRFSADEVGSGSLSDGGSGTPPKANTHGVVMRKSPKHRSPNHNRFSHQFSLCCKAEKKPLTPPVTVRYNSIPDANSVLKRDNLSLSWNVGDNASISMNSYEGQMHLPSIEAQQLQPERKVPVQKQPHQILSLATTCTSRNSRLVMNKECVSAPQSPVAAKQNFAASKSHSSPSSSSLKSSQSEAPQHASHFNRNVNNNSGPIRPIAVSACRSRLRLKLYPPGFDLPPLDDEVGDAMSSIRRATTPQHMSSPNIATQPDFILDQSHDEEARFMSHENMVMHRKGSSSGLARHALMAAQVLSLIPTEKARERSFLDGRLGTCSLLGPTELNHVLPSKQVTIFVGTWNMNGQNPPKQLNDFVLPTTIEHMPDIVAMGTQESSSDRFEWEVTLQETLGPSHVLFHSNTLGTLHLAIFMRRDLIWYCSAPEDASLSVRTGSAFRTKGAVAISFCLFGTSMLFVTSHLTAHQQKVKERVSDVKRIIHALDLPRNLNLRHKSKDVTQNFDNVFWCGDLNFRLGEPREKLLEWIQNTKFPLPSHLPHGYMHTDQLSSVLADGAAFHGFMEANITFPPTYKYDPGTQYFDTSSKQRAPAYTDRILYKYRHNQGLTHRRQSIVPYGFGNQNNSDVLRSAQPYVECLLYDSVPSITTSDHKPVWALFKTQIRAGTDSIPLAAGLFSRDIYLEGMKRRLNNRYSGSSVVCVIQ